MAGDTALTLGGFQFADFEVPEEIDGFGGEQLIARHVHPGGIVIIQEFGDVPHQSIIWSGYLMDSDGGGGTTAATLSDRVQALRQLEKAGDGVQLQYAMFSLMVVVHKVTFKPRLTWMIPYTIEVTPYQDQSAGSMSAASSPSSMQQLGGTLSGGVTQDVQLGNDAGGFSLNTQTPTSALTNFQKSLTSALQSAQTPQQANTPAVQQSLAAAQAAVAPFTNSSDPAAAAFAFNAKQVLNQVGGQLSPQQTYITQQQFINPDLMRIAGQVYGDPNKWTEIAKANKDSDGNMLITPSPIGDYTLLIPALP